MGIYVSLSSTLKNRGVWAQLSSPRRIKLCEPIELSVLFLCCWIPLTAAPGMMAEEKQTWVLAHTQSVDELVIFHRQKSSFIYGGLTSQQAHGKRKNTMSQNT